MDNRSSQRGGSEGRAAAERPRGSAPLRWIAVALRLPVVFFGRLFAPTRPSRGRRDFIQGKFWKLVRPPEFPPLVMRYPKAEASDRPAPKSIGGIAIEPVPASNLAGLPRSRSIPVFRPPGAIEEGRFLAGCTRCGDCITACPYQAIRKAPQRLGSVAGTPVIEPDVAACLMCEDLPCIAACEPGVLTRAVPVVMGTAKVTEHLCLAHHGTTCTTCSERCPVEGAIAVAHGKPTVNEAACAGCGVCRYVCPAPENAILLMPAFIRPTP
ncbi:quinol dehydrogenase periplasmic component [Pirellulimonas nuda]|uniref:Quinol dehydrogenase periplasmic component n=1 Tax=Pirellulimonas nuda TaxID=2528009 RepID=A0A518DE81_9BACT|nr:4Fe-4S dicluster domain-containing protein [Pirellulimonas nuda]QDU89794.1 quinol dehydrogenase periplasmic component [Pirellulimonas nuda]